MSSTTLMTLNTKDSGGEFQELELPAGADSIECASCAADRMVLVTRDGLVFTTKIEKDNSISGWKKPLEACQAVPIVTLVDVSPSHYVALTSEQTVVTWGKNNQGQLGRESKSKTAKRKNKDGFFAPDEIPRLKGIKMVQIACGRAHNVCLSQDGRVFAWGANDKGQLGDGSTSGKKLHEIKELSALPITQVCAGGSHSCALTATGRVLSWGSNSFGQLGLNSKDVTVLRPKWGMPVGAVTSICCGENHTAVLTRDGRIFTCGQGDSGQLGHDGMGHVIHPQQISELDRVPVSQIACGRHYTVALEETTQVLHVFGPVKRTVSLPTHLEPPTLLCGKQVLCLFPPRSRENVGGGASVHQLLTLDLVLHAMGRQTHGTEDLLKRALSSASCINGSFIQGTHCSKSSHAVHLGDAEKFFRKISQPPYHSIAVTALTQMLMSLPNIFTGAPEELRVYLILITNLYVDDQVLDHGLVASLVNCFLKLNDEGKAVLGEWIKGLPEHLFRRCVWVFKMAAITAWGSLPTEVDKMLKNNFITSCTSTFCKSNIGAIKVYEWLTKDEARQERDGRFFHLHDETVTSREKTAMEACFDMMASLYEINESRKVAISSTDFHLPELDGMINVRLDFLQRLQDEQTDNKSPFRFSKYRFLYDAKSKLQILECQCNSMQGKSSFLHDNLGEPLVRIVLRVRRDEVVQDSKQISDCPQEVLRLQLDVTFQDETDYCGPGIRHEYFQLLFDELLHPDYGVFCFVQDSKVRWFRKGCCPDKVKFVGLMCGLALYNGIIVNLQLPRVLYKKLLNKAVTFDDLNDLKPDYHTSMKGIILDEETEDFGLDFTVPDISDPTKDVELTDNGEQTPVTQLNKREYVKEALNYYLNTSIEGEFQAFSQGFFTGIPEEYISTCQPGELKEILEGNERYDFVALERVTEYGGDYSSHHGIIRWFWQVLHAMDLEDQKRFLRFLTGTDRIPTSGMEKMKMTICPREEPDKHPNALLPHATTCINVLRLPRYTGKDNLERNLLMAVRESSRFYLL